MVAEYVFWHRYSIYTWQMVNQRTSVDGLAGPFGVHLCKVSILSLRGIAGDIDRGLRKKHRGADDRAGGSTDKQQCSETLEVAHKV